LIFDCLKGSNISHQTRKEKQMFKDDPRAVNDNVGRYYSRNYEPVMIGKKMTIEQAQEMFRRDAAMDYRKTSGASEDRITANVKAYQKRRREKLKAAKEVKNV